MKSKLLYLVIAVIMYVNNASAKPEGEVWKKQVARVIDMADNSDSKVHHLKQQNQDSSLVDIIISAVKNNKFAAYSSNDLSNSSKISATKFISIISPMADTVTSKDPVTGKEKMMIITKDLNTDAIHRYRVIENWTFNTVTGKTDIEIVAVAPIQEILSETGVFVGIKAMFWVRYSDLEKAYSQSRKNQPLISFANYIWEDYFFNETKPSENK